MQYFLEMKENKQTVNLHFSQKLCWQHGIITASLKNELHREHFISDGRSACFVSKGSPLPILYVHSKQNIISLRLKNKGKKIIIITLTGYPTFPHSSLLEPQALTLSVVWFVQLHHANDLNKMPHSGKHRPRPLTETRKTKDRNNAYFLE